MDKSVKYDFELNRRLTFRLSIRPPKLLNVKLHVGDVLVAAGRAADIALGGLSVVLDEPLPYSVNECRARFVLPYPLEYECDFRCEIVHVTEIAGRTVCGVEFLDLDLDSHGLHDYGALWNFLAHELEKRYPHLRTVAGNC